MKTHIYYKLVLITLICALDGYGREVDVNYLTQLRLTNPPISRSTLPHSDQNYTLDEVINTLRKMDAYEWIYGSLLMRLKDPSTMQKYAKLYGDSHGKDRTAYRAIADSNSPWMIPEIIDVLLTEKPPTDYLGDDQIRLGPAGDTRVLITTILATSPEFPSEVRDWARDHLSKRNIKQQNELINTIRNWWKTNEAYFRTESFNKVQVPAFYSEGIPREQPTQQLTAQPATIQPTPEPVTHPPSEPTPEPVKPSVTASMSTLAAEPAPAEKTNPAWWTVGLIILAAGVVFVARRKQPRA